ERQYAMTGLDLLNVQPNEHVLEVGFGTGHVMLAMAKLVGNNGKVSGIDISERMCAITQRRLARAQLSHRVNIHCGDAMKMPFSDNQFNALFMSFTLELFDTPEIPRILMECKRVLKSQGRFVNVSLLKQRHEPAIEQMYEWIHRLFPRWVDCRPINATKALKQAGLLMHEAWKQPLFGLKVAINLAYNP
ncbi:MAG: class I SAM-dependent methyltransferase, partial [Promethearchaeota archaeon]